MTEKSDWRERLGAFFASLLIALALVGCQTAPDRVALNSLQTVKASAESTLRVAAALRNAGEITEAQWASAVVAYRRVEAACKTAAAGVAVVKTYEQADVFADEAKRFLDQLKKLVDSFAPKPKPAAALWRGEPCLVS